jgi:NAD(P)-dependent dehydrogenase (short-subunit alcohol dehydrogenase family)
VRDAEALQAAFDALRAELGPVRHLVCGAAGNFVAPAEAMSAKGFRTVVEIDLLGSYNTVRAAHAQLAETRGTVLFISGGQSYVPFKYQAHVAAAKAGIDQLMRSLALEWGGQGIRLNSLVPGPIQGTEGMNRLTPPEDPDFWTRMVPLGRMGEAAEIAQMAVLLASPLASYVNGALIAVDGGQNLSGSAPFNEAVAAMLRRP